jgi:hypothetical protein
VSFGNAAWLLLALPVLALWLMQWRGRLRWLSLALLLVLALADPKLDALRAAGGNLVLLVDRSASVQGEAERRARSLAPELERRAQSEHAGLYIVGFGRGAAMLARPGEAFEPANSAQDDSDLLAGLQLAAAQPDVSEIVLVSDGVYTTDDPTPLALQLRQQGTRIHSLRVGERPSASRAGSRSRSRSKSTPRSHKLHACVCAISTARWSTTKRSSSSPAPAATRCGSTRVIRACTRSTPSSRSRATRARAITARAAWWRWSARRA